MHWNMLYWLAIVSSVCVGWWICNPIEVLKYLIPSLFIIDLISGHVHWMADAYTPYSSAFRNFEVHHYHPTLITKAPWIFNIREGLLIYPPLALLLIFIGINPTLISLLLIQGIFANQFHRFAHTTPSNQSWPVKFLMKYKLILSTKHHNRHHENYGKIGIAYCITYGYCNWFLDTIGYWRFLEKIIYHTVGLKSAHILHKRDDPDQTHIVEAVKLYKLENEVTDM